MLFFSGCEGNRVGSCKKGIKPQPFIEGTNLGATTEEEMLSCVNPLFLSRLEEGRYPTAENARSLKETDPASSLDGCFCSGDSRQTSANDA